MIHNETEREITHQELERLRQGLTAVKNRTVVQAQEWIQKLELDALRSQIDTLETALKDYTENESRAQGVRQTDAAAWEEELRDRLPIRELLKRDWVRLRAGETKEDAIESYLRRSADFRHAPTFHRRRIRGNVRNEYSLWAWRVRVLEISRSLVEEKKIPPFKGDVSWGEELVSATQEHDGPKRAVNVLARSGIPVVIQPHLPGTYLDGAAMLDPDDRPVIGLTLRFDRLDHFWFVLLHELGHVFLHLLEGVHDDFFDDEGAEGDALEREADSFALDTLIPQADWAQCLSRFAPTSEAVVQDAKRLGVGASVVAGRIRREQENYALLSDLIGEGTVKCQFGR